MSCGFVGISANEKEWRAGARASTRPRCPAQQNASASCSKLRSKYAAVATGSVYERERERRRIGGDHLVVMERQRKIEKKRDSRHPRLENYTWLLLLLFIRAVCWMRRSEDGWVGCLSSGDGKCEIKVRRKGKSDRAGAIFSRCRGKSGESGASDVTTYLLDPLYDFNSLLSHCSVIPFPNKTLCPFLFPFPAPRCRAVTACGPGTVFR